jgi:archaeal type IV pilus assembly protein PilA
MKSMKNSEAVSPVIGTILMVMISVMLGVIIGSYAFDMAASVQNIRMIATSVTQSGSDIRITYQGGDAQPDLYSMSIIAPGGTTYYTVSPRGALSTTGTPATPDVGAVMVLYGNATSGQDRVVIIGHFIDGSSQIISDTFV